RLSRGEIILGDNWKLIDETKDNLLKAAVIKNEKLNDLSLQDARRRGMLQFMLAPANIALSIAAPGVPVPLNSAAFFLDTILHKPPIDQMGPPTTNEIAEKVLGPWYLGERQSKDSSYMQGRTWNKLNAQEKSDVKSGVIALLQNVLMPEDEIRKLYYYLEE